MVFVRIWLYVLLRFSAGSQLSSLLFSAGIQLSSLSKFPVLQLQPVPQLS